MMLTNAGGLWYAKSMIEEYDGVRNLLTITRATDIRINNQGMGKSERASAGRGIGGGKISKHRDESDFQPPNHRTRSSRTIERRMDRHTDRER